MNEPLFGNEGNYEDYWLGTPYDKTWGQSGWYSIELFLRAIRRREVDDWGPSDEVYVTLLRNLSGRGGGLTGTSPQVTHVRQALIRAGTAMREAEARADELTRRHRRA